MRIVLWKTESSSPIEDFIMEQPVKSQAKIQWVFDYFEQEGYGLMRTHYLEKMDGYPLHELRINGNKIEYRFLTHMRSTEAYLLHAFIKKDEKTRISDINLAMSRKANLPLEFFN